jgi:hypothetical protein
MQMVSKDTNYTMRRVTAKLNVTSFQKWEWANEREVPLSFNGSPVGSTDCELETTYSH